MPNASGSWNLSQQLQAKGQDLWPKPPGAPTIGTATLVTATSATVAFTAPTCKGIPATITGYQAISTPGCITATGGSSPITVSGLTSGTAYTFQVRAQNSTGYGSYSASSNSVQAKVPGAPTIGTATAGLSLCASVTFTAPACTGVPAGGITGYMVTSTPGCITKTGASSPLVVTGLTCGTAYTFKVKAQNAVGYGACSAASNSVTAKQPSCVFYSIVGSYSWVAPAGVTSVSVVAVGGGGGGDNNVSGGYGGGGGGLGYRNCIAVTPGSSYTVVVGGGGPANTNGGDSSFNGTAVGATGGKNRTASGGTSGGAYSGSSTGGGSGGSGGNASSYYGAGGGGAGGYAGNGGGGGSGCGSGGNGTAGSGGGGGGGGGGSYYVSGSAFWNTGGGGGGGVGIYGQGSSGAAGVANSTGFANPTGGGGGSGGATGAKNCGSPYVGMGGNYGGGGPGGGYYCNGAGSITRGGGGSGGTGAVRIVWKSPTRGTPSFPSTNVGPS